MTTLPLATDFTDSAVSKAEFKTAITNLRVFLSDLLGTTGTQSAAQVAMMVLIGAGISSKSTTYTVTTSDRGKVLNCTGTWTLSLLSAATAGNGFCLGIKNSGSGTITIAPNGSDTTDAATLAAGGSIILACTGTGWIVVGGVAGVLAVANGGTGATTAAGAASNLGVVKTDCGQANVGSFCFARVDANVSPGSTVSGASLTPAGISYLESFTSGDEVNIITGSSMSGTWRCLGFCMSTNSGTVTLFQRIA